MPKLRSEAITAADLREFLDTSSDFAFELRCLEQLSQHGFEYQHGGPYDDPVTNKTRQFDIRATTTDGPFRVALAVECKNLAVSFPLLITCMPRAEAESYHEVLRAFPPRRQYGAPFDAAAFSERWEAARVPLHTTPYDYSAPVGKGSSQVGRVVHDNSLHISDSEVFDKWCQALASAQGLIDEAVEGGEDGPSITLVLPILVVPDGTLWAVDYTEAGTRLNDPQNIDRASFYVGRQYGAGDQFQSARLTISHLEIVTYSLLPGFATSILGGDRPRWLPAGLLKAP